jgi:hypothetical protein
MQDRRYRPGDVLDDYCPRERRITDHAIVAMIDDEIRRTRCGICDAEHEYKDGKVPTPRRKTQPPALFTQVLEGMNGPVPQAPAASPPAATVAVLDPEPVTMAAPADSRPPAIVGDPQPVQDDAAPAAASEHQEASEHPERELEGGFRRSLIRATFPRPDGQAPPPRALPEFTIQSLQNRRNNGGQRHAGGANKFRGGRRRPGAAGGGSQDNLGPMRFRDHGSQQGDRPQGQGQGQGGGRRRRGGKKNR